MMSTATSSRPLTAPSPHAPAAGGARRRSRSRTRLELAFLLAPALVLFTAFVLIPICVAAYYSLFRWNGLGPLNDFVGFGNYSRAFQDPVFQKASRGAPATWPSPFTLNARVNG